VDAKTKLLQEAYIQISGQDIRLYSGCFDLTTQQREQVRNSIYENLNSFNAIINNPSFVKIFSEVRGEKYKKIPAIYLESAEIQPLLLNKSFYFYKKYKPELALNTEFLETIVNDYKKAIQINEFLREALK